MRELSILIPARNEIFLRQTVENILENIEADTEIIIVLDGEWSDPGVDDHERVRIIHVSKSVGQRAATNMACRFSNAKYVMKCDAHCSFDKGFDRKMIAKMQDDYTMVPVMKNLHAFDWVCPDGHRRYQGPSGPCEKCGQKTERDIVWKGKPSPNSKSYCVDETLHFQYFNEYTKREKFKEDLKNDGLTETMSLQGSCWMLTRDKYWELNVCDESHGSWGQQGAEVAFATWLSGGKVLCNHDTWYAHMFRTSGGDFGFPYELSGKSVNKAREYSRDLWFNNKHLKQKLPFIWLLDRFYPVRGWSEDKLRFIFEKGSAFPNFISEKLWIFSIISSIPGPMASHTSSVPINSIGQNMPISAMSASELSCCNPITSQDVVPVRSQSKVHGITTGSDVTDMVQNRDILALPIGDRTNEPGIHKSVDTIGNFINSNPTIPMSKTSSPNPASSFYINSNFPKNSTDSFGSVEINGKLSTALTKGIIYFTDNQLELKIARKCQEQLRKISRNLNIPIVSASLKPMNNMGKNIHIPLPRGKFAYYTQILAALEASEADIIFFAEHDVFYSQTHFEFTPPEKDKFYYNYNWIKYRTSDGFCVSWNANQVSQLCGYRETLLNYYRDRIKEIEEKGFDRSYEPGGRDPSKYESWKSLHPNIDLRHGKTMTKDKWSPKDFRDKSTCVNWQEGYEIPEIGDFKL